MGRQAFKFTAEHVALMGKIPDMQLARLAKCSQTAVVNRRTSMGIPTYSSSVAAASIPTPMEPASAAFVAPAAVKAALKSAVPAQGGMLMPFDQYALLAREFLA